MDQSAGKEPSKRGRRKGQRKTGGRAKGTPNRNSLRVLDALDRASFPLVEMLLVDIAMLEPAQRIAEYKWLMQFCYPRLKEIDHPPFTTPPPAAAPAFPAEPAPMTREERIRLIRGHVPGKPETSGQ